MKKVDPKKIASGQRPRYQRRWERTATTTRKEVEKREAISAERLEADLNTDLITAKNKFKSSEDEKEPLPSRYQRRGVSPRQLLAAKFEGDLDDALHESEAGEEEELENEGMEDSGHFLNEPQNFAL